MKDKIQTKADGLLEIAAKNHKLPEFLSSRTPEQWHRLIDDVLFLHLQNCAEAGYDSVILAKDTQDLKTLRDYFKSLS